MLVRESQRENEIACASLASHTDFMLPFTVFRVHLPGRNRFDFLLFGKLFFSLFVFAFTWLTFPNLYEEVVTVCFTTTDILFPFHCSLFRFYLRTLTLSLRLPLRLSIKSEFTFIVGETLRM